jgi:carboxyl-terminal processing protease
MYDRRNRSRWPMTALAAVVVLCVGLWFGGHPSWLPGPVRRAFVATGGQDSLIDQVYGMITRDYYRPIPRSQLVNAGLAGAVASLDDPYSHYYDPSDYRLFQTADSQTDTGIGVEVDPAPLPNGLAVVEVFQGSPAAKAGIVAGDVITSVGRRSLAGRSLASSTDLIQGASGTRVTLTILSGRHRRTITLVRAAVAVPNAIGRIIVYRGVRIGYIALASFSPPDAGAEVRSVLRADLRQGARALILDLRENGGGLVSQAVNVASAFIPDGTILSTAGRAQPRQVYLAQRNAIAPTMPMVVLVDQNTASAAEIVTGALKDRGRALVVGTHTYGKGVFQEIQPLPNGGALDFTVGHYYLPDGDNLGGAGVSRGRGILPNVYAYTAGGARSDTALLAAERTVAAELR